MHNHSVQLVEIRAPLQDRELELPELGPREALIRVEAAGVCRSDLHYTTGASFAGPLPLTLGHEVAGTVERCGAEAETMLGERGVGIGDRVAVHYLVTCGHCRYCMSGHEQFCTHGRMIGKHRNGGFAEYLVVPARNLVRIPESVATESAAIMMCSTATSLHALHKAELAAGDRVAVFGIGGLGLSAVQLARAMGALEVYAVDINEERLEKARAFGATPVDARSADPVHTLRSATDGGVNCAVELLGLPATIDQALRSLAPMGRLAIAGIAEEPVAVNTYRDVVGGEAKIVGVSDHTRGEVEYALALADRGKLRFADVITNRIPLEATAINDVLSSLATFGPGARTVVVPTSRR